MLEDYQREERAVECLNVMKHTPQFTHTVEKSVSSRISMYLLSQLYVTFTAFDLS